MFIASYLNNSKSGFLISDSNCATTLRFATTHTTQDLCSAMYNATKCVQCVCVLAYRMSLALGFDMADLGFLSPNTTHNTKISLVWWPFAQSPGSYQGPGVGFISWCVCLPEETFQASALHLQKRTDADECFSLVALANVEYTFWLKTVYVEHTCETDVNVGFHTFL